MGNHLISVKFVAVTLCLMLLAIPVLCQQEAANQARADVERNVNGGTWLIIGIFAGVLGYVIAMLAPPKAPASALLGKSPEYVAVYTETYEEAGKKIQMRKAMTGCLIGTGIQAALIAVILLATPSAYDYY